MLGSLYRQLLIELKSPGTATTDREEALIDFVSTPYHAEKVLSFGSLIALDAFLYTITILPLRALLGVLHLRWTSDMNEVVIICLSFLVLQGVNTSRVYHAIRSQAGITMFVLYSLMEVCDKFFSSVGHEIASCISSRRTIASFRRTMFYTIVNLSYTIAHSFVLMWQLVTLNLAVNSYSNALLSFMLTNQFSEIKSAVFKRFDEHSLLQLVCADIAQRFQFASLLMVIVLRNILEFVQKNEPLTQAALGKIAGPAALLMGTVVVVDWLKIAYIVNFNSLSSDSTFSSYMRMLKEDYSRTNSQCDRQNLVAKQAGLPVPPLVIVCVRMFAKGGVIPASPITLLIFVALLLMKLHLGSWLYRATSTRRKKKGSRKFR